jgi:hypothetical protein
VFDEHVLFDRNFMLEVVETDTTGAAYFKQEHEKLEAVGDAALGQPEIVY